MTAPTGKDLKELIDQIAVLSPTVHGIAVLHAAVQLVINHYFDEIAVHHNLQSGGWFDRCNRLRRLVTELCAANPDDENVPELLNSIHTLLDMFDELLNNPPRATGDVQIEEFD
ncbi:MAG: hypothetical protein EBU92_12190 [Betaproteobacteria bacterium]|nr:hypothetical protein [Betaproteobacteria bacterium]